MNLKKTYFENLDGLRFIAFLSVFITHIFDFARYKPSSELASTIIWRLLLNGDLGVNFFFVLSGFLITFLLLQEKKEYSSVSVFKFYMRRVLRIWPVYFLTIVIGFFIIPSLFKTADPTSFPFQIDIPVSKLPWYLGFAVNFDMVLHGVSYILVVILWSVSVEEQFYLVWPLIHKINSKYFLITVTLIISAISFCYRWKFYQYSINVKYSTFSIMDNLAIGSLFATLSFYSEVFKQFFEKLKRPSIITIYIFLFCCICLRSFTSNFSKEVERLFISIEPLVFSFLFGFIILEQNYASNSFFKISKIKSIRYLGTISYGLYCYHMICIFLVSVLFNANLTPAVEKSFPLFIAQFIVALSLTILVSSLSYRFFESGFLKLKKRFVS